MIENTLKKKCFILNCNICDTRKVREKTLTDFDNIVINTDIILQNTFSKEILMKYPIVMNCDTVIESDKEIILKENLSITSDTVIDEDKVYIVTNKLSIEKGCEEVLAKFDKVYSLGSARYPESLANLLSNFTFSGDTLVFPDDSIVMDNTKIIDDIFEITAKDNSLYYAKNKIVISKIDVNPIIAKGIKFKTKKLIVDKALLAKTLPLFNSDVELVVLPENCSYHNGNATLDPAFIKKHGNNVYVDGSTTVNGDSNLSNIEYLFTNGDVNIIERLQDDFMKLNTVYNNINFIKGKFLGNVGSINIDKFMLETSLDGVLVENFVNATISENVSPELIVKRLSIRNGGNVSCSEEQIGAVQMIASNVGNIGIFKKSDGNSAKEFMEMLSNNVVNADYYVL